MAVELRDEDVAELNRALLSGRAEIEGLMQTLHGRAVQGIQAGLAGTVTSGAFEDKITHIQARLRELTPQFEELGKFVQQYMQNFHEADQAQANSLR